MIVSALSLVLTITYGQLPPDTTGERGEGDRHRLVAGVDPGQITAPDTEDPIGAEEGDDASTSGDLTPAPISARTLVVAVEVDRDHARLLAYTVRERAYRRPAASTLSAEPDALAPGAEASIDVSVLDAGGKRFTARVPGYGLCLEHDAYTAPHIEGDTIRVHRDSFLVELPELAGYDRLEIAVRDQAGPGVSEARIAAEKLDAARFVAGEERIGFADLAFADRSTAGAGLRGPVAETTGSVHWPEEYGDPDRYKTWGWAPDAANRVNVVIVPDGYTYAEKATMDAHAADLVARFRSKTPYAEHDPLINYTLVYAFSNQSGTDECDCSVVMDTAMNTRFPAAGGACGDWGNRCLYYGTANGGPSCDPNTSEANIAAAELRAPAKDFTIVMVNTARFGGCGGSRAVYSAANPDAAEIALHELGHTLAGLADEYGGSSGCGSKTGYNVSIDAAQGTWPEWVPELGTPSEGGAYFDHCIYRPEANCAMRVLGAPFCRVCSQRFALSFFGHPRVSPTAPISSTLPASPVSLEVGKVTTFSVATRLGLGAAVTNRITWSLTGPGYPTATVVAEGVRNYTAAFAAAGTYTLKCEVEADTNFIKAAKAGANLDVATWSVVVGGSGGSGGGTSGGGSSCGRSGATCTRGSQCCSGRCDKRSKTCR